MFSAISSEPAPYYQIEIVNLRAVRKFKRLRNKVARLKSSGQVKHENRKKDRVKPR